MLVEALLVNCGEAAMLRATPAGVTCLDLGVVADRALLLSRADESARANEIRDGLHMATAWRLISRGGA